MHRRGGFFGVVMLLTACSAEGPILSKRSELEPRIAALRAARKTAAELPSSVPTVMPGTPPIVGTYDDASNTLVIVDEDIDGFDHEVDCLERVKTGHGADCRRTFGAGNGCAVEVASILKFGHYRDRESPWAREAAAKCASWLAALKYVLVVHFDQRSMADETADTNAKGWAAFEDLASARALAKFSFNVSSHEELGGAYVDRDGRKVQNVLKDATSVDALLRSELGGALVKAFPRADVQRWK